MQQNFSSPAKHKKSTFLFFIKRTHICDVIQLSSHCASLTACSTLFCVFCVIRLLLIIVLSDEYWAGSTVSRQMRFPTTLNWQSLLFAAQKESQMSYFSFTSQDESAAKTGNRIFILRLYGSVQRSLKLQFKEWSHLLEMYKLCAKRRESTKCSANDL